MNRRLNSKGDPQNMLVDHLFQFRISPWPKAAKKRGFCTGLTDGQTDRRTDRPTDGQTDQPMDGWTDGRTDPLIEMRSWRTHLKMQIFKSNMKIWITPLAQIGTMLPGIKQNKWTVRQNTNDDFWILKWVFCCRWVLTTSRFQISLTRHQTSLYKLQICPARPFLKTPK